MMKTFLLIVSFLWCPLLSGAQSDTLATQTLGPAQMAADFTYLNDLLTETHPGLYRYTSKIEIQHRRDSVFTMLSQPLPFYEFYKIITAFLADIRCAHTNALPTNHFNNYLRNIETLPFFMFPVGGKLYVIFNGSPDTEVTLGYELIKINDHPIDSVIKVIKRHYWSDGQIDIAKNTALQGGLFCLFYYSLIERPNLFRLEFKDLQGSIYRTEVSAQKYRITEAAYVKNKINHKANQAYNQRHRSPWRLSFPKDVPSTAVLRFDAFGGKGQNTVAKAKNAMQKFMNESLRQINSRKCDNLIVDVRSNSGGWDSQGLELFSYLMKQDTAVRYYQKMHVITDSSRFLAFSDLSEEDKKSLKKELKKEPNGTFVLREEFNSDLLPVHPKPNRFKGNVYILQNERSFSAASEFVAACKTYQTGLLVGVEAGGAYGGGNGGSFIHMTLPHSHIRIGTPLVYYDNATRSGYELGRGTMPDQTIVALPEDLVNNVDRQLSFLYQLILEKQSIR